MQNLAEIAFLISLLWIFYPYTIYPMILYMFASNKKENDYSAEYYCPSVTLIISAYNEESVIRKKLMNSLELDYPSEKLSIVVASESNDETNDIVREFSEFNIKLFEKKEREGKSKTIFDAMKTIDTGIVVFSDANGFYEKDSIRKLVKHFISEEVGVVSGKLQYINRGDTIDKGESFLLRMDNFIKVASSLLGFVPGVYGSIFAIRTEAFLPIDQNHCDDFDLSVQAGLCNFDVIYESDAISYEETSKSILEEFKRKERMVKINYRTLLHFLCLAYCQKKYFIFFQLISHKFIRWTSAPFILIAFLSVFLLLDEGLFVVLFCLGAVFATMSFIGLYFIFNDKDEYVVPALLYPSYFIGIIFYYFIGVVKSKHLDKYVLFWNKNR